MTTSTPWRPGASPARAATAAGSSSPGLLVTTASRAREPRPACSSARPSHRSRQPRQSAERNRSRAGAAVLHHVDPAGRPSGRDALDVTRAGGGRAGRGRDGTQPAQDVGRRLGHGTFDGAPARCSSSMISTTLRPWPHQRHTTSSTCARQHLLVLDDQVAADRVVVEGLGLLRDGDVEAGEVAAAVAAVSRVAHAAHGSRGSAQALPGRLRRSGRADDLAELDARERDPGLQSPPRAGAAALACSSVSKTATRRRVPPPRATKYAPMKPGALLQHGDHRAPRAPSVAASTSWMSTWTTTACIADLLLVPLVRNCAWR